MLSASYSSDGDKIVFGFCQKKKTYTYSSYKTFINKEDPKACRLGYREEVRYEDSYVCKNKLREFRN